MTKGNESFKLSPHAIFFIQHKQAQRQVRFGAPNLATDALCQCNSVILQTPHYLTFMFTTFMSSRNGANVASS